MKELTCIALIVCCLTTSAVRAEVLSVDDVSNDFRIFITAWQGEVDIQPAADDSVSVDFNCPQADGAESRVNEHGLRVISSDQSRPELRKSDDRVTFIAPERAGFCRIAVSAPATAGTQVRINDAGKVSISDWQAVVTAWSASGDVTLQNQKGPFSITAMNGNATIDFRGQTMQADSAATAANGVVSLYLAGEPPLTLRTQARWGEVATNLDAAFTREQIDNSTWSVAKLAGGGPVVTLRNLNSDIVITRGD
jgi:hypothetical protein